MEKSPINLLCLEAAPTPVEQEPEMEQQQGGNWTLEDIKGALLDNMKAMMQNELSVKTQIFHVLINKN